MRRLIPVARHARGVFRSTHAESMYRPYGGSIGAWAGRQQGRGFK